jgi:ABC-2 type transport system ATP-binding protein
VAILARGKVIQTGRVSDLTRHGRRFEVRTLGPVPPQTRDRLTAQGLGVAGDLVSLDAEDVMAVQPVIDLLRAAGIPIREVREARFSLEDIFLQAVQESGKEAA